MRSRRFVNGRLRLAVLLTVLTLTTIGPGCHAATHPVVPTPVAGIPPQQGSSTAPATAEIPRHGGTLVVQTNALIQFDPIFVADDYSFQVVSNVFSLLFRPYGAEPIPDLATGWEWKDARTIIFRLREGVAWQDGNVVFPKGASREVVASDVVYSVRRAVEAKGAKTPADLMAGFESIEAIDDHTVRLTLKAPNALLFAPGRGLSGIAIVPREAVEQLGDQFSRQPIGSGPFRFVEYRPDESLTLERNEQYWKRPLLDRVVFRVIPDQGTATIGLETGEIDILWNVSQTDFQRLQADRRFVMLGRGCPSATQLVFNVARSPYDEPKFREAIATAVDREAVGANAYGGMYVAGCGTAGPGIPGYVPDLCQYFPYDPTRAERLLTELGWADADGDGVRERDGKRLEIPLEVWSAAPMPQLGTALASELRKVGVDARLQTVEMGTYMEDWSAGAEKAMLMGGFCGDGGMNSLWSRNGFARPMGYDDGEVFDLLDQANTIVDPTSRDGVLQQAARRIYSQYWAIPLGFRNTYQASRAWVHDVAGTIWTLDLCTEKNNVWVARD